MSKRLTQQLIRLGNDQPELRNHLRPILDSLTGKTASGQGTVTLTAKVTPTVWPLDRQDVQKLERTIQNQSDTNDLYTIKAGNDNLFVEATMNRPHVPAERLTEERTKDALASALQMAAEEALNVSQKDVFVYDRNIEVRQFDVQT